MRLLKEGQILNIDNSQASCTVHEFIGGGGQGEVYKVAINNTEVALKWYYPNQATDIQKQTIEKLINIGAPNKTFLWPQTIVVGSNSFGYTMPLRKSQFKGLVDLMKRRVSASFTTLVTACIELPNSFYQLHAKGLCYRDISFGNVFFDPKTGNVLICDNDNVGVDGQTEGSVLGTPRFMAPEIVRGEVPPSLQTDLFSLAVLLFYMLMVHHPLEGEKESKIKCFDLPAMNKLYGYDPVFIFDPNDDSNRPTAKHQENARIFWNIYPSFIKKLFIKTFTEGLNKPYSRIRETEWRASMIRLRDSILYCNHCGSENFFDEETLKTSGKLQPCWNCKKNVTPPPNIKLGKRVVMLNHNTHLFEHHINKHKSYDFTPIAEVTQHPDNPQIWGLKNISKDKWVVTGCDGKITDLLPNKSTRIIKNKKIHFGTIEGVLN